MVLALVLILCCCCPLLLAAVGWRLYRQRQCECPPPKKGCVPPKNECDADCKSTVPHLVRHHSKAAVAPVPAAPDYATSDYASTTVPSDYTSAPARPEYAAVSSAYTAASQSYAAVTSPPPPSYVAVAPTGPDGQSTCTMQQTTYAAGSEYSSYGVLLSHGAAPGPAYRLAPIAPCARPRTHSQPPVPHGA